MKRLIAGGVVAAVAVFGGANAFDDNTVRDESGAIVEGGGLGAFAMRQGDCFNEPDATQVVSIEAVPCTSPHDAEVYHIFEQPDGDYPGAIVVEDRSYQGCFDAFEPFTGVAWEESMLDFFWLEPTRDTWNELDDREVVCAVYSWQGEKLTGSMAGSGI